MNEWSKRTIEAQSAEIHDLRVKLINSQASVTLYWVAAFVGWVLFFSLLLWPDWASAADELHPVCRSHSRPVSASSAGGEQ